MKLFGSVFLLFFVCLLFLFPALARAQPENEKTSVVVFIREGCVHCQDEEEFLTKLSDELKTITLRFYRLENPDDRKLWEEFTASQQVSKVTPITIVGNTYLIGFDDEQTTGKEIRKLIFQAQEEKTVTDLNSTSLKEAGQQNSVCPDDGSIPCSVNPQPSYLVSLPFLGKIDSQKYPLIILSALLGFFDGFNPCAMWVLVTFLIILIEVGNRKKMIVFAGTFILAEALMYSLILTIWYKTWDFVRLDTIITPIVGAIAIVGGLFFLREWHKKELECKVTNLKERSKTKLKIQQLAINKFTLFTFLGILGIAFSVNIIEFACSIGIPQAFTKILELNNLALPQWLLMIGIYIFFYMLDDLVVFGLAIWGADYLGLTTKYSKLSNLLGGIVMIILGLLLLFKSQLLLF
ncbi:glutaredoxin [Candidatus Microgenomates bacterium]|nr:glutaredoxin [Candidatus Microgenomates bacterium]